ncbi:MAG TPA: UDP-N-acetylmuramate dehydrogenase [Burkholderiales bacterium]|nr:UDP-N-acetylmuramate dehydrogenase [Burkholderiales bacterium]
MTGLKRMTDSALRGELRLNEPMARHTSWRAGGCVARAYFPADLADLCMFMRSLGPDEPVCLAGLGSNLLVRDGGLAGTVIFTHEALDGLRLDTASGDVNEVYAEAGVASPKVARFAALHELAGAEFLAGVPGTVGGALAMNAGCYGGETWNIVSRVSTIDRAGEIRERSRNEYETGYRHVQLKAEDGRGAAEGGNQPPSSSFLLPLSEEWFIGGWFRLARGEGAASRRQMRDLLARRIATQPLSQPNAGSVFRNPQGDYAARLIESCGLKGRAIGGAQISGKHANFIVNVGNARAAEIEALMELAERSVREKFGIVLEREVRIVGER